MTALISKSGPQLTSGATTIFDPAGRPLAQAWGSTTYTVGSGSGPLSGGLVFPDLDKSYAYWFGWETTTGIGGSRVYIDGCVTTGIALPQEWGPVGFAYAPGKTIDSAHQLPDIDLGPAPLDADGNVAADFVEMTINLTRSVSPNLSSAANKLLDPWPLNITTGAWIDCEDGACTIELGAGLARSFWVEIVNKRIVLRRRMSVTGAQLEPAANGNPAYYGLMTHVIEGKYSSQGEGSQSFNRGQANACSIHNAANYLSTYAGTIIVTPVNYRET